MRVANLVSDLSIRTSFQSSVYSTSRCVLRYCLVGFCHSFYFFCAFLVFNIVGHGPHFLAGPTTKCHPSPTPTNSYFVTHDACGSSPSSLAWSSCLVSVLVLNLALDLISRAAEVEAQNLSIMRHTRCRFHSANLLDLTICLVASMLDAVRLL